MCAPWDIWWATVKCRKLHISTSDFFCSDSWKGAIVSSDFFHCREVHFWTTIFVGRICTVLSPAPYPVCPLNSKIIEMLDYNVPTIFSKKIYIAERQPLTDKGAHKGPCTPHSKAWTLLYMVRRIIVKLGYIGFVWNLYFLCQTTVCMREKLENIE